jgi:hypothetical protein
MSYSQAINNYTNSLNAYNQQIDALLLRHKQDVLAKENQNQQEKQTINTIGIPTGTALVTMSLSSKGGKKLISAIAKKLRLNTEQQEELQTELEGAQSKEEIANALTNAGKNAGENVINNIKAKISQFIDRFRTRKYTQLDREPYDDDEYDIEMEDLLQEDEPLINGRLQLQETQIGEPVEVSTEPISSGEIQPAPVEEAPAEAEAGAEAETTAETTAETVGEEIGIEAGETALEALPVIGLVAGTATLLGSLFGGVFSKNKLPDPVEIPEQPNLSHPIYSIKG